MKRMILTHRPLDEIPTTPVAALKQVSDVFRACGETKPMHARWRAHLALAHAAKAMKDEPYLYFKAAALVAELGLNPNDGVSFLAPFQRTNWVETHLLAAYVLPFQPKIFVPRSDIARSEVMAIVRLAQATGISSLTTLMNGVLAKHFGTGVDPIAARIAVMNEKPSAPVPVPPPASPALRAAIKPRRAG